MGARVALEDITLCLLLVEGFAMVKKNTKLELRASEVAAMLFTAFG